MKKIKDSQRVIEIEKKWKKSIEGLLYCWHWKNNLMHKEIGKKLSIPRPTITRWFNQLKVPCQSCTRFTNNNLLYMGPNRLPKKPKPPKKIKERVPVNENFFKKWSAEMAYILGYFAADGCMFRNPRGSYYIGFYSIDKELILKTQKILNSEHKIGTWEYDKINGKIRYQLQIGSKKMFNDLSKHGLTPNKSIILRLPNIPKVYFRHFIRGYFDGDGCVSFKYYLKKGRKKPSPYFNVRFSAGGKKILSGVLKTLKNYIGIKGGYLYQKQRGHDLSFSVKDSFKLYKYMYMNVSNDLYLERKYNIFQKALNFYGDVA